LPIFLAWKTSSRISDVHGARRPGLARWAGLFVACPGWY
jgi:hypothetical protein